MQFKRAAAVLATLFLAAGCGDSGTRPADVALVSLSPGLAELQQGASTTLQVTLRDGNGNLVLGRAVAWSSGNPAAATVSADGVVSAVRGGVSIITATAEGRSASATITVSDTVASVSLDPTQLTMQPGATATFTATPRNDAGGAITGRTVAWSSSAPAIASVVQGQVTAVSQGTATITATVDGRSANATVTVAGEPGGPGGPGTPTAPAITAIAPALLVPGATATITATNLAAFGNTVTIGGVTAPVTASSAWQLQVTVPCVPSGSTSVVVTTSGTASAAVQHPLQVTHRHSLAVGESVIIGEPNALPCNELPAGGQQKFVLAVYNTTVSANAQADYRISGAGGAPVASPYMVEHALAAARARTSARGGASAPDVTPLPHGHDVAHLELLEKNRVAHEQLMREHGGDLRAAARLSPQALGQAATVEPPLNTTIRVSNINSSAICSNFFTIQATRVYYSGRLAIYEDDATPAGLKAANNPTMANYYRQIGDQYNADMEPVIRNYFGDPLRRDHLTDNDGVLRAVFTPVINNNLGNVAGFVVSCDQFPNSANNTASNHGEYFYAYQPTSTASGFTSGTADQWFRSIRSVFIHEAKHVASHVARVANNAVSWEVSWLEEGTARHAEEIWARNAVYNVPWMGNTGYGSAASPTSVYCDVRPSVAACNASNPRRPASIMYNHFATLYSFMGNPGGLSPFGRAPNDNSAVFYAASWSLLRYAADRYAGSEQAFFTGLNQSSTSGAANLSARTGVTMAELLGRWALALYADDMTGLGQRPELQFGSWNLPGVYSGLRSDFAGSFGRPSPLVTTPLSFGTFGPVQRNGLVGGGIDYFEITGNNAAGLAVRLESVSGGAPSSVLRMAILRVQ